jgi:hypothetical protein
VACNAVKSVKANRRLGGTFSRSENKPSKKSALSRHSDPEDEHDMFLQNFGFLSVDYMELCNRTYNSS